MGSIRVTNTFFLQSKKKFFAFHAKNAKLRLAQSFALSCFDLSKQDAGVNQHRAGARS
jgi:hypothetical protein